MGNFWKILRIVEMTLDGVFDYFFQFRKGISLETGDLLLSGRVKNREAAKLVYERALELNPGDGKVRAKLSGLP